MQLAVYYLGLAGDGRAAVAVQLGEEGALAVHGRLRVGVVEGRQVLQREREGWVRRCSRERGDGVLQAGREAFGGVAGSNDVVLLP